MMRMAPGTARLLASVRRHAARRRPRQSPARRRCIDRGCRRLSPADGNVTTETSLSCEKRLDDSEEQLRRVLLGIVTSLWNGDHLSERQRLQLTLLLGRDQTAAATDHVERRRLDLLHVVPKLDRPQAAPPLR